MTVRERVADIQGRLLSEAVTPTEAAKLAVELAALHGRCLIERAEAEVAYSHVLLAASEQHETAVKAKMHAQTSDAYAKLVQAKAYGELTLQVLQSLKAYVRAAGDEARLG